MDRSGVVVLLVEDDPGHAELVKRNLQQGRLASRLFHVSDGQAALDYLCHQDRFADAEAYPRPDLILLDLRLPRVDGLEVLRRVKEDPDLASIPVVVLTTSHSTPDLTQAYERRVNSYLVKPVDFQKFSQLMDNLSSYWLVWNQYCDD